MFVTRGVGAGSGKGARAAYCSRRCRKRAEYVRNRASHQAYARARLKLFVCIVCGMEWHLDRSGGGCDNRRKFCSKACYRVEVARRERIDHPTRACERCGETFEASVPTVQRFCSEVCRRQVADRRRGSTAAHRARRHGAEYERVEPHQVFMRDGWRCQICGKRTPPGRRGTLYSNAPELDHRVPLSKGGPHTYANTQTACRACNRNKSNRSSVGQMPLFVLLRMEGSQGGKHMENESEQKDLVALLHEIGTRCPREIGRRIATVKKNSPPVQVRWGPVATPGVR